MIWCDICGRKQAFSTTNFSMPPMLISTVGYGYNISSSKIKFSSFLRSKIINCLHKALKINSLCENYWSFIYAANFLLYFSTVCLNFLKKKKSINFTISRSEKKSLTSSGTISLNLTCCDLETDDVL